MRTLARRCLLAALLPAVVACVSGCGIANLLVYPFAPREAKKDVKREHDLTAERLLILPFAGHDVLFEHPNAGLQVSYSVVQQISEHLRGRVHRVVNPAQVALYQRSTLDWPNMDVAEIGREFEADKVLYIELSRFTIMEERSANLYRGRVAARIEVIDTAAPKGEDILYEGNVAIEVPEDEPIGTLEISEGKLLQATLYRFAEEVVWKFYDHQEKRVDRR